MNKIYLDNYNVDNSYDAFDFFIGGIPPFLFFDMEFHCLFDLIESHKSDRSFKDINPAGQVAYIGLISRFEAFCKHQFAAIINIYPDLLSTFTRKRNQPTVEFSTVFSLKDSFEKKLGFVLAEKYDFGTSSSINSLFQDLLLVAPFSKDDIIQFDSFLYKRNLLVHHAGYYTLQYLKANSLPEEVKEKAFREAVTIDTEHYHELSDFLFEMAIKIARVTVKALKEKMATNQKLENNRIEAADMLLQGVWDRIE